MSHPKAPDPADPRIAAAEADLADAEQMDLASASNASLVLMVTRLRSSLAGMLRLLPHEDGSHLH